MALLRIVNIVKITHKKTKQINYKPENYCANYIAQLYNKLDTMEEVDKAYSIFLTENTFETMPALYDELTDSYYKLKLLI